MDSFTCSEPSSPLLSPLLSSPLLSRTPSIGVQPIQRQLSTTLMTEQPVLKSVRISEPLRKQLSNTLGLTRKVRQSRILSAAVKRQSLGLDTTSDTSQLPMLVSEQFLAAEVEVHHNRVRESFQVLLGTELTPVSSSQDREIGAPDILRSKIREIEENYRQMDQITRSLLRKKDERLIKQAAREAVHVEKLRAKINELQENSGCEITNFQQRSLGSPDLDLDFDSSECQKELEIATGQLSIIREQLVSSEDKNEKYTTTLRGIKIHLSFIRTIVRELKSEVISIKNNFLEKFIEPIEIPSTCEPLLPLVGLGMACFKNTVREFCGDVDSSNIHWTISKPEEMAEQVRLMKESYVDAFHLKSVVSSDIRKYADTLQNSLPTPLEIPHSLGLSPKQKLAANVSVVHSLQKIKSKHVKSSRVLRNTLDTPDMGLSRHASSPSMMPPKSPRKTMDPDTESITMIDLQTTIQQISKTYKTEMVTMLINAEKVHLSLLDDLFAAKSLLREYVQREEKLTAQIETLTSKIESAKEDFQKLESHLRDTEFQLQDERVAHLKEMEDASKTLEDVKDKICRPIRLKYIVRFLIMRERCLMLKNNFAEITLAAAAARREHETQSAFLLGEISEAKQECDPPPLSPPQSSRDQRKSTNQQQTAKKKPKVRKLIPDPNQPESGLLKAYCWKCGGGPFRNTGPCPSCRASLYYGWSIAAEKKKFMLEEYERSLKKWISSYNSEITRPFKRDLPEWYEVKLSQVSKPKPHTSSSQPCVNQNTATVSKTSKFTKKEFDFDLGPLNAEDEDSPDLSLMWNAAHNVTCKTGHTETRTINCYPCDYAQPTLSAVYKSATPHMAAPVPDVQRGGIGVPICKKPPSAGTTDQKITLESNAYNRWQRRKLGRHRSTLNPGYPLAQTSSASNRTAAECDWGIVIPKPSTAATARISSVDATVLIPSPPTERLSGTTCNSFLEYIRNRIYLPSCLSKPVIPLRADHPSFPSLQGGAPIASYAAVYDSF